MKETFKNIFTLGFYTIKNIFWLVILMLAAVTLVKYCIGG